jgi:hypothetical protein
MESVRLLIGGGLSIQSDRSDFGFSWKVTVLAAKPTVTGIGFPWISLDSLVRIETYQWVTRIKAEKFFPTAFVAAKEPSRRLTRDLAREREDCSWRKLNSVSDFLQDIAVPVVPVWPPPSQDDSLQ